MADPEKYVGGGGGGAIICGRMSPLMERWGRFVIYIEIYEGGPLPLVLLRSATVLDDDGLLSDNDTFVSISLSQ